MNRYTLTVNAIGGLCNRLRAIAAGVHISDVTDRALCVVWNVNDDLAASFEDLFQPLPDGIILLTPSKLDYWLKWEMPRKKNAYISWLYQVARYKATYSDAYGLSDFHNREDEFLKNIRTIDGDILIATGTAIGGFDAEVVRRIFKPNDRVKELVNAKIRNFDEDTIGVHIRRTDNQQAITYSTDSLFISVMEKRIEANDRTKFFIASDDSKVMHALSRRFGERVMCGDMHVSRKKLSGMLQATADLWALSRTKEIIGSYYSSYSEMAALIGEIPMTIVI